MVSTSILYVAIQHMSENTNDIVLFTKIAIWNHTRSLVLFANDENLLRFFVF